MVDLAAIRADFPLLSRQLGNKPVVYLDSACMSLRPQPVIDQIATYYTHLSACAGRSNHALAREVSEAVERSREKVRQFIGAKKAQEIVFTRNTSEGINLVARSLGLKAGDVVLTTDKEHNSNLVPWLRLRDELGIEHKVIPSKEDNTFDMGALESLLDERVKLVSIVHTSNLDGVTNPISEIAKRVHGMGALFMVDGAQSVPHSCVDVVKMGIDFFAFSAHKLCGPSGMGVLYGRYDLLEKLGGFMVGGDTVEYTTYTDYALLAPPEKFEAGLQDYAGIMGVGAAIDYVNKVGEDFIREQDLALNTIVTQGISEIPRLHIIGPKESALRSGVVSFYVDGVDSHQISLLLNDMAGIAVRSGRHCVHSWFEARSIHSSVRASFYFYNTTDEAHLFVETLAQVLEVL